MTVRGRVDYFMNMADDAPYEAALRRIIHKPPYVTSRSGPTQLIDHVFLGDYTDAYAIDKLRDFGITHVLNCAAFSQCDDNPYDEDSGITAYKQFHAKDEDGYNMLQHFDEAKEFIDSSLEGGGRSLVHCAMGINRSAIIAVAYIMLYEKKTLLDTVMAVKNKRGTVLCNKGFRAQLIEFARERDLLGNVEEYT